MIFVIHNLTQRAAKFFQNFLCSWTPSVLLPQPQLVRNHFLVSLPKNNKTTWCNLLVVSNEVWNVRALTISIINKNSMVLLSINIVALIDRDYQRIRVEQNSFSCQIFASTVTVTVPETETKTETGTVKSYVRHRNSDCSLYFIALIWDQKFLSTTPSKLLFVHLHTISFFLQPKRSRSTIR